MKADVELDSAFLLLSNTGHNEGYDSLCSVSLRDNISKILIFSELIAIFKEQHIPVFDREVIKRRRLSL
jgi:hypothetical protein